MELASTGSVTRRGTDQEERRQPKRQRHRANVADPRNGWAESSEYADKVYSDDVRAIVARATNLNHAALRVERLEELNWNKCKWRRERLFTPIPTGTKHGLLLHPGLDHLFDNGYVSFDSFGKILLSKRLTHTDLKVLGIRPDDRLRKVPVGVKTYMAFHREQVFMES